MLLSQHYGLNTMELVQVLKEYGWGAVLLLIIVNMVWPIWKNNYQKQVDLRIEEMRLDRQEEIEAVKADREERATDLAFRREINERLTKAYEALVSTQRAQEVLMTAMNERMNQLAGGQSALTTYMMDAVSAMRERVAQLHPEMPKPIEKPKG